MCRRRRRSNAARPVAVAAAGWGRGVKNARCNDGASAGSAATVPESFQCQLQRTAQNRAEHRPQSENDSQATTCSVHLFTPPYCLWPNDTSRARIGRFFGYSLARLFRLPRNATSLWSAALSGAGFNSSVSLVSVPVNRNGT